MNHTIIILSYVFVTFAISTPLALQKRNGDDQLNGFEQCDGHHPIVVKSFSYSPIPLIAGQNATNRVSGEANAVVKPGAVLRIMEIVNKAAQTRFSVHVTFIF